MKTFALILIALAASACSRKPPSLEERSRAALSQTEGRIAVPGLSRPVEVLRDTWGVPHIYAQTVEDLFFAQGFVVAQDRLFQMDMWRRAGRGELAEILGHRYLERDRIARLIRYRGDIDAEWTSYGPDSRAICAGFARGVNALVASLGNRLPIEFQLLGTKPGEWKAEDCLLRVAGLLMSRNVPNEVARARMMARLGPELTAQIWPPDPPVKVTVAPGLELGGFDDQILSAYQRTIAPVFADPDAGSNNWVVDGTLSATGKPLLANDPHRPVVLPSLRYITHLVGPGWNVIGAGEPAVPGVALGHNERAAFGFTIVGIDQADLFVEKLDPQNPLRYQFQDTWREMRVERETAPVQGQSPAEVELKFTVHGPVIFEDRAGHRAFALRWAGSEPGTAGYLGCLALNRIQNWTDFLAAMERWRLPSENLVYADVDGNIGWMAAGLAPLRRNSTGLLPVPGWTGAHEWTGFLPTAKLPRRFNPPEHYIATANHNILPRAYPHALGYEWAAPYRFRRIDEVLRAGKKFTVEDFQRLQHDENSVAAREMLALLKSAPSDGSEARRLLDGFDGAVTKESAAAILYELWVRRLTAAVITPLAPSELRSATASRLTPTRLAALLEREPAARRNQWIAESLREAEAECRELLGADSSRWRWGGVHKLRLRHPLANDDERRRVFDPAPVPRGGDGSTVNSTGGGFRQTSGASYRQIMDVADWDRSVATSVPGQSGQPASPHYADLLPLWAEGKYFPLVYTRAAVEKNTRQKLVLEPR